LLPSGYETVKNAVELACEPRAARGGNKDIHHEPRAAPNLVQRPRDGRARRGHACDHRRRPAHHRRLGWRRGRLPRPRQCPGQRGDRGPAQPRRLRAHCLVHQPGRRGTGRDAAGRRARRPQPRLFRVLRLGGHGGRGEAGAAIFPGDRPAAAQPLHRPARQLSRQHAGGAGRRRQHDAPRALRAAAVRRVQPCQPMLRLSLAGRRRDRRAVCAAAGLRAGSRVPAPRPGQCGGLLRRAGGRRHHRLRHRPARLFPENARDLRSPWRAADPGRGDVRHGPHRQPARLAAGRREPGHPDHRQGARRRLPADRRHPDRATG
jgi:hypothetical protein